MKNCLTKRMISLLLCLAMFLSMGTAAFAEEPGREELTLGETTEEILALTEPAEEPEEGEPEEPVFFGGDGDGLHENPPPTEPGLTANPRFFMGEMDGGTFTDENGIASAGGTGIRLTPGTDVWLTPLPDEGYVFTGWSITCNSDPQYYLDVDEDNHFRVGGPYVRRYADFEICAYFELGQQRYPLDCLSEDPLGTGSSISVDQDSVLPGETVIITVDRKPGAVFADYLAPGNIWTPTPYARIKCRPDYAFSFHYMPLTRLSDTEFSFTVPEDIADMIDPSDLNIHIYAQFEIGEYAVTVDGVSDPEETGNTVTATEGAGLDETVTVNVMMRYATAFGTEGLQIFWLDGDDQKHDLEYSLSGSSVPPYSSSGETTYSYTFLMPEHDVHITADFVKVGHYLSIAPIEIPGQLSRGRFFQGTTNLSTPPNEQRAVAGDTITAVMHVEHEENMGSYGVRSAWISWEENGVPQRQDLENLRADEYLYVSGDFEMPDADAVLHMEVERSWWILTEKYSTYSLDPDKWETFAGDTVSVTANLFDGGSETFEGWNWHVCYYENGQPVDLPFTVDPAAPNRISFQMPAYPVSVSLDSPYAFIWRRWTGSQVEDNTRNPTEYTLLSTLQDSEGLTLTDGFWVLAQNMTFSYRLRISGDVHLILCDGAKLTCSKGIELAPGNSLTIYGQKNNTGALVATGPEYCAGIGGGDNIGYGDLTIHGGTVKPTGGNYGAGIGTGDEAGASSFGCFTIYGGSVTAQGGSDGAGIGGGNETGSGQVIVYGGKVTAKGGEYGAGIGTGDEAGDSVCGSFTMYGGEVTATGGIDGAGIGGGNEAAGGTVVINKGTLTAEGKSCGAGIGGGDGKSGGNVTIYGGKVTAKGGTSGAGIGGGDSGDQGGTVLINGGSVTAKAGNGGAGVGGGAGIGGGGAGGGTVFDDGGSGGTVIINGGNVIAKGTYSGAGIGGGDGCPNGDITITGGTVYAACTIKPQRGAGIGGGGWEDQGGTITITGGKVTAKSKDGAGIGGGYHGDAGTIIIQGGLVTASSEDGAGIGGGDGGDGGSIYISDGVVIAASTKTGAGIGGGDDGDGGYVEIRGGHVTATGGYFNYDYWKENFKPDYIGILKSLDGPGAESIVKDFILDLIFSGEYGGAGIGGGDGNKGGTVKITGGTVIATAGTTESVSIGYGDEASDAGSLSIYDEAMVIYGSNNNGKVTTEGVALSGQREDLPRQKTFSIIQPCTHPNAEYTSAGEAGHRISCPCCGRSPDEIEPHKYEEGGVICTLCGFEQKVHVTLLPGEGSGETIAFELLKGSEYIFPACGFTAPTDMEFVGWKGSVNGGAEQVWPEGSSFRLTRDLTLTARWSDPYRLWVNGVKLSGSNKEDVLGDGKVSYDPDTFTLSLRDPVFDSTHEGALIYADDLDLTLTGSGTLGMSSYYRMGVCVMSGSLTIDGDFVVDDAGSYGLRAQEDVIFRSGTVEVQSGSIGVWAERNIYVRSGITRVQIDGSRALSFEKVDLEPGVVVIEHSSANRLPPDDEWDLDNSNHVVFAPGIVVTFVLNGGVLDGEEGQVQRNLMRGLTVAEPDPAPTREGYNFGGWYSDEGLTLAFDFETELDDDTTLYAKWTRAYTVEIQWEKGDVLEEEPDSVKVVLQRGRDGQWTTVQELTLTAEDEWKGSFDYVPDRDARETDQFRVRELEYDGGVVLDPADGAEASDQATVILLVDGEQKGYLVEYRQVENATYITNSSTKQYSVELSWDIDLGDQDRPDEIEVVLQRQVGKFTWKSVELITLEPGNGWSGEYLPVPVGYVDEAYGLHAFVFYKYRIRQLRPKTEQEQQQEFNTEEERLAAADKRVVHDTFDLDKDYIAGLVKAADPDNLWTIDFTVKWVMDQATKIAIPPPTFTAKIAQYTDFLGKEIPEHESKYHVKYAHNSSTHLTKITDTAVLDVSVYKRWLFFEENEKPESVYLMLMSKVNDEYAEHVGVEEVNIYTPVATVVYGSQLNVITIPGVNDEVKSGIESLLGKGFGSEVAMDVISKVITPFTNTHIALAEAKEEGNNCLTWWSVTFGVKKYGAFGVPMDFAGAELITGLMEMAIDGIIKALGIPKISCPVMYHPIYKCWSIKGYALNIFKDYELTCNVINLNFTVDDYYPPSEISGVKTWENDTEDVRPEEIKIHVYGKAKDGSRTEITGSPITVTAEDNWEWSLEIPFNDVAVVKQDGENSSVTYRELEVEEEVPDGYEASYDSGYDTFNITNTYTGTKTVSGHKSWDDKDDADGIRPESITICLLADGEEADSRTVSASDDWKWSFTGLPLGKDGKEIEYTIEEKPVEGYETSYDGYNVTNTHTPEEHEEEKVQVSGHKIWDDGDDADRIRPRSITIRLLADGVEVDSRTVTWMSSWTWSFTDLPKFSAAGLQIVYSVREDPVEGYETSYSGYNVINSHTPDPNKIKVEGKKTWNDLNDADGLRPHSITIRLFADGAEIDSLSVSAADDWSWSFSALPKYRDDGETEIRYSIAEDPVEGYITEIDGYNVKNTIVSRVYGYNLYLKGRIGLNVYLFIPQRVLQDSGLYVTLDEGDGSKRFPVSGAETRQAEGLTVYMFSVDKAAKEMNDPVTVRLYGGGGSPETLLWRTVDVTDTGWSYTIQTYIDRTLESVEDPLLRGVVTAMNDYGSLAQAHFHHNEGNRAPILGNPETVTLEDLKPYEPKLTLGKATGVTYAGSSLDLQSETAIRHYFSIEGSPGDYTFKLGSKVVTPVNTSKGWMIEIPELYARHLNNMYTLTVSGGEGRILTLRYGALSYAYVAVERNEAQDLVDLVKAMYRYNRAACAFFDHKEG